MNKELKKLQKQAERFALLVKKKKYAAAKQIYDEARDTAVDSCLPESDMNQLFGNREKGIEGMFPERNVQKVFYEVAVKG